MNRTALILALSLFAPSLALGFAADAVTGAAQHGVIGLALISLIGAAPEAWITRKG